MFANPVKRLIVTALTLSMLVISTQAFAAQAGSPAWIITSSTLFSGPGTNYPAASDTVTQGQAVTVTRCSRRWCTLAGSTGWLSIDDISFGQTASGPFSGPKLNIPRGSDGKVCFHDGINFSGTTICLPAGAVARDLVLWGWDNRISSVSISGDVTVNLCRDRNFSSYCILINKDTANLDRLLANAASSYQVYVASDAFSSNY